MSKKNKKKNKKKNNHKKQVMSPQKTEKVATVNSVDTNDTAVVKDEPATPVKKVSSGLNRIITYIVCVLLCISILMNGFLFYQVFSLKKEIKGCVN